MPRKFRGNFKVSNLSQEQKAKRERCIMKVKAANTKRGAQGKKTYNAFAVCNSQIMGRVRKRRGERRSVVENFFDFIEGKQG